MQKHYFKDINGNNNGGVIHKILVPEISGKVSAWFDNNNKFIEMERIVNSRTFQVKKNARIWNWVVARIHL